MRQFTFNQYIWLFVIFCLICLPGQLSAQTGIITGQVRMSGDDDPIPGVRVSLIGTTWQDTTDENGTFTLSGIPPGGYKITAVIWSDTLGVETIEVRQNETIQVNFAMDPPPMAARPDEELPAPPPAPGDGDENPAADAFAGVDSLLQQLETAHIAFNAPDTVGLGEVHSIQLLVSLSETIRELSADITAEGNITGDTVQVAPRMEARLSGTGFQIESVTPEIQLISRRARTEWRWDIIATETGTHQLHLTLSALIPVDGQPTHRTIRTFDHVITVHVSLGERIASFLSDNWQWIMSALLIPLITWLFRVWWKERSDQSA